MTDASSASAAGLVASSHPLPSTASQSLSDSETAPTNGLEDATQRLSLDERSASYSSVAISYATLWRNKSASCENVRSFEASRKAQIDVFQEKDRAYWLAFEKELVRGREENTRVQRFFTMKIQADLAYAESLRKIRQVLERPPSTGAPATGAPGSTSAPGTGPTNATTDQFSMVSSCVKALNTLGEVQQQLSEKIVQFTNVVKRDVVTRPLDEMIATYDDRTSTMLAEGNRLDVSLHEAQRHVIESFSKYDAIYREMEADRQANGADSDASKRDLWLAEIAYCINVNRLQKCRVEYVKGMSALFQQYKNLEMLRVSVIQTAIDTYTRKQKLMYDEMGGAMSEPMSAIQRIEPERDVINSIRRIPKNFTAAALSSEGTDQKLFRSLRSPIASPLLVRCGFLKHQVTGSIFRSWKDVLCAITQDQYLHLIDLKETANRTIVQSSEAMLDAILTNDQTMEVVCTSISLANCRINMIGKSEFPTFEVTESTQMTGLLSTMFRMETSRKFTFQCTSQTDLIDWVVAAKRFIPPGASSITATAQ